MPGSWGLPQWAVSSHVSPPLAEPERGVGWGPREHTPHSNLYSDLCLRKTGRKAQLFGTFGNTFASFIAYKYLLTPIWLQKPVLNSRKGQSDLVLPSREDIPDFRYVLCRWSTIRASNEPTLLYKTFPRSCCSHDHHWVFYFEGRLEVSQPHSDTLRTLGGYRYIYFSIKGIWCFYFCGGFFLFPCP